jgi:hypothetical protein
MLETIDFEWIQKEDKKEKSLLQQFVLYSANTMTGFPRLPLRWCSQRSGPGRDFAAFRSRDIRFCSEMGDVFQA